MSAPHDITVRHPELVFPDEIDPVIVPGQPEESYFNVALSLLLPFLEPYLIRSMNAARPLVDDEGLRADLDHFNAQEGQHYRQHRRFNDVVRAHGFPTLPAYEEELQADYEGFSKERSLRFNLAYAEGFEAMTSAFARVAFVLGLNDRFHPAARALFTWHMLEELEHRTVAFDVYHRVCGGYFYRLVVGMYAQWHMSWWITRVAVSMWRTKKHEHLARYGGWRGVVARVWAQGKLLFPHLIPAVLRTYLPGYSPHKIPLPDEVPAALAALALPPARGDITPVPASS